MTDAHPSLAALGQKKLEKVQASYSAVQILTIFSVGVSVAAIAMLGYSIVTSAGWTGFLLFTLAWNLPLALMLWKRPALGYWAGFIYLLPAIPSILGLIVFIMWFRTKPYFGRQRVTISDVKSALYSNNGPSTVSGAIPA